MDTKTRLIQAGIQGFAIVECDFLGPLDANRQCSVTPGYSVRFYDLPNTPRVKAVLAELGAEYGDKGIWVRK